MKTMLRESFGKRIRQLRESMGLTQEQLASKVGMDYKYLGSVERGERNITIDNIQRIAEAFGVETYQLFFFSLEGLKPQEEVIEEKIEDILERCDAEKKQLFLRIIAEIAKWE
jgi:transcriptional regulator with XRE-family HTH domain